MDALPNIDRFNRTVLLVLAQLLEAFPVPIDVDTRSLAMASVPDGETYEGTHAAFKPAYYAVDFLAAEGYLSYLSVPVDQSSFRMVRLTSKALAVMGATPVAISNAETLSSRIRAVVKSGVREAGSEVVKKVVELVFAGASASFAQ